ncbi:hypothetical protein Plec18170_009026 [Paecilomyces lecythidis]
MAPFGTIYTYPNNPRVMKVQAAARLNGLEITEAPNFAMGKTNREPEFLAKFPLGKVPALACSDGFNIWESDAIAQYVAESGPRAAQLVGSNPRERALIQQWISFSSGEALDPVTQLVLPRIGLRPFDASIEERNLDRLTRSLDCVEKHLQNRAWLATDQLSLADISLAAALFWGFSMVIDVEMRAKYPKIVEWYKKVLGTEGVKEAFGEQTMIEKRKQP